MMILQLKLADDNYTTCNRTTHCDPMFCLIINEKNQDNID